MSFKENIIAIGQRLKMELQLYTNVFRDKRTPIIAKVFFGIGIGYLLLPST
jgi:hypothetical protein